MNEYFKTDNRWIQTQPLPVPFEEQKWGVVTYWYMLFPGVFVLGTTREEDVILVERADPMHVFPEGVFQYGAPYCDGTYVYFGYDNGRDIAKYELLLYQAEHCSPSERQAFLDAALIEARNGAEFYPDYFGPWTPQHMTPWGRVARYITADNGVWFIQAGGQ